ncbi:hypothetical protein [Streptomyces sp. NRRL F-5135]|uniref:hypothetical protein n=1 Tax=Streptomyces sp. NRRL F-5135 TaxID=1463858 RepID=UPI0004CC6FBB|nr:hypothetical protein [Streptomyces sp. NRRL F-5135]
MPSPITRPGAVLAASLATVLLTAPGASAAEPPPAKFTNQQSKLCIRLQDNQLISDCYGTSREMTWTLVAPHLAPVEYRYMRSRFNSGCPWVDGTTITLTPCTDGTQQVWVMVRYEPQAPPAGMAGLRLQSLNTRKCLDTDAARDWAIVPNTCSNFSTSQQWNIPLDAFNAIFTE